MRVSAEPLIAAHDILARVRVLGEAISTDCRGHDLVVLPVLKGGAIFAADLLRAISAPVTLDYIRAKSYEGALSSGTVEFTVLPEERLTGKHVLVVEDILDTGRTSAAILDRLRTEHPASLTLCVLLDKPARRTVAIEADYSGFTIGDLFVVGYGLDYHERFRGLPGVHVMEEA